MAVKQYIGARYVPLLDGDYDVNKTYEPLTTVNYGNATYTSKKKVPAGVVPTDSNYWMQTGFGNQQVSVLNDWRNNTVDPFIQQAGADISDLDDWRNNIVGPFIQQTGADVSELQEAVTGLSERVFILLGDSYGTGVTGQSGGAPIISPNGGWYARFIAYHGLTLGENVFTTDMVGDPHVKSFSATSGQMSHRAILESLISNHIPADVLPKVTDIIVLSGTNDVGRTGVVDGIDSFMSLVKTTWSGTKKPIVKIGCLMGCRLRIYTEVDDRFNTIMQYKACQNYGACYIDNSEYICAAYDIIGDDNYHPSEAGYSEIMKYVNSLFNAQGVDVQRSEYIAGAFIDTAEGDVTNFSPAYIVTMMNDTLVARPVSNSRISINLKSAINIPVIYDLSVNLGKIRSNLFNANGIGGSFTVPINGFGTSGDGYVWQILNGALYVYDDGLVTLKGTLYCDKELTVNRDLATLHVAPFTFDNQTIRQMF